LRAAAQKRQYKEAAVLFQAINQLAENFTGYRNVKQIADLLSQITTIQMELKRMVFGDFEGRYALQSHPSFCKWF
jgi:hypothetical protein